MKTSTYRNGILALTALVAGAACSKEETPNSGVTPNYVMSLRTQEGDDETADYFLTVDDLMTGEISAEGIGEELVGWNYNGHYGNTYFAIGYDLNECVGYRIADGRLKERGKFVFERMDAMAEIDENTFLAVGAPWGGGSYDCSFQLIDAKGIGIKSTSKHPIYTSYYNDTTRLNAWPTGAYLEGNKLFVSFYPLEGESWATPNTDTAYVSVFSYPSMDYIKTIKDARVAPIGYYGGSPAILEDEMGNHFTISGGAKSIGFTQATKPSGILKIDAGTDEFNANYHFDVEAKGYRVLSGTYVGNGLVVARVISTQMDELASQQSMWAAFSEVAPILNVAVLDLNNYDLQIVTDVPLHGGQYQTPYLVEDGKVYISVNDGQEAYVYRVNPETATAEKGAKLIGNQFQALYATNQ